MQVDLKRLKPIGIVLILVFSAVATVMFFTMDFGVPPRYTPEHNTEYYLEHMEDLLREVQGNLVPDIPGIVGCYISPDGSAIILRIERKEFDKVKAVITRDFDEDLFLFVMENP